MKQATNAAESKSSTPVLPEPLQIQIMLICWMLDRAGYDLAARPTLDLAFDALMPKGQRKWLGSQESEPSAPPRPQTSDMTRYSMQLGQRALEIAYVASGIADAELIGYCRAMCAKGAISRRAMAERILNCYALLWKDGTVDPKVRDSMTNALDEFIHQADQVVARRLAWGQPANPLPREWRRFRRTGPSRSYSRDGRDFPQFATRAMSTLSP